MTIDKQTIRVYDANATEYHARFGEMGPDAHLSYFISALPKGAKVLDLGCGPGHFSDLMRQAGLEPDPIDASAEMVTFANKQYDIGARLGTFDDIDAYHSYHGIWANYSLLHALRADLPRYFKALHQALLPDGVMHLAMKKGSGEGRDSLGRYYTYLLPDELIDILCDAGFTPGPIMEEKIRSFADTSDISLTLQAHA